MPQQQAWPAGVKVIDEGLSLEKQKQDTLPPTVPPPSSPVSEAPGAGLSFLNAVDAPFSLFNEQGSLQMPPIASNFGEILKGMTFQSKDTFQPGEKPDTPDVVRAARGAKDTYGKITKGSTQEKATAIGDVIATILQTWLTGKAMGKMFPKGMAPKDVPPPEWQGAPTPPPEWQGPIEPQGPATPPPAWQGPPTPPPEFQGPMPEPQGPQVPPSSVMRGPKPLQPTNAQRYGPKAFPDWQGPIEPQGPQRPAPPWQGPIEPQGPQMPESVIVRGLNPKNKGWFSSVETSKIDPDILRRHLNAREELNADALKKTAKAPKPPTKSTPKTKGKK